MGSLLYKGCCGATYCDQGARHEHSGLLYVRIAKRGSLPLRNVASLQIRNRNGRHNTGRKVVRASAGLDVR